MFQEGHFNRIKGFSNIKNYPLEVEPFSLGGFGESSKGGLGIFLGGTRQDFDALNRLLDLGFKPGVCSLVGANEATNVAMPIKELEVEVLQRFPGTR